MHNICIPSEYLAIDETLYAYGVMVKLKEYNSNKPAKYGFLYRRISDSDVPYTYFTLPFAGKPEIEGSEFYVTGTDGYSVYLVDKLSSHVDITGMNVSMCQLSTMHDDARCSSDEKKKPNTIGFHEKNESWC